MQLKFSQNFNFGSNIILNDISKVIGLDIDKVKRLMNLNNKDDTEFIEKKFFENQNFRKIKKQIIYIAKARIEEIADIIFFNNINTKSFLRENLKFF